MSWSVSGLGRPAALAAKMAADFARIPPLPEPEETGKVAAATSVAAIVPVFPPMQLLKVECNGSQYTPNSTKDPNVKVSHLTIRIESIGTVIE